MAPARQEVVGQAVEEVSVEGEALAGWGAIAPGPDPMGSVFVPIAGPAQHIKQGHLATT